mgnify:CR=1 FL=1
MPVYYKFTLAVLLLVLLFNPKWTLKKFIKLHVYVLYSTLLKSEDVIVKLG